jgi:hypothetical protein
LKNIYGIEIPSVTKQEESRGCHDDIASNSADLSDLRTQLQVSGGCYN